VDIFNSEIVHKQLVENPRIKGTTALKPTLPTAAKLSDIQKVTLSHSGESRIIFLPERSSICQYRPKISAINIKKR